MKRQRAEWADFRGLRPAQRDSVRGPPGVSTKTPATRERHPHYPRCDHTDHARSDQRPASLFRQLLDALHQLLVDGAYFLPQPVGWRER
jgi:hypothetical protein